ATRAISRINEQFGCELVVRELFEHPTVAAIAEAASARARASDDRPPLTGVKRPAVLPLSLGQQRMWFINQYDSASAAYNIPLAITLTGRLDIDALRAAFSDLVARHEVLRTYYPATPDGPIQVVQQPDQAAIALPLHQAEAAGGVREAAFRFAAQGFDVTASPPIRAALWRAGPQEHLLVVVMHHISGDGSSLAPLINDLMTAFIARREGNAPQWEPLEVQYADFAIWQREVLGDEADPGSIAARQIAFWREALSGLPDLIELPLDHPRPPVQDMTGGNVRFTIPAALHARIATLAQQHSATPFMLVHAAFAVLLARISATTDITVATPMAGRAERALDQVVGMFVNTLVLRTPVDPASPFSQLVDAARAADITAFGNADVPFERLVEVLDPVRSQAHAPLAQVGYSYQNLERPELRLPGLVVEPIAVDTGVAQYDLHLHVQEELSDEGKPLGLHAAFTYATILFDESTIQRLASQFVRLLDEATADPSAPVGDIDILEPGDRALVLESWGRGDDKDLAAEPSNLAERFDAQAARSPGAIALVFRDDTMTYAALDARSNQLARYLIEQGVGPEVPVGLSIRRSFELLIAMYAIVKAGGAYVPIDPDHPRERNDYVLEASEPACVLTTTHDAVPMPGGTRVVQVDQTDVSAYSDRPVTDADRHGVLRPGNTAYIMFTSGSTGRPKGVMVSHAAIVNQIAWKQAEYQLDPDDVVLQKIATTFDVSVWEFWWALSVGARLVISEPDMHQDPAYVASMIEKHSVTATTFVPSPLSVFVTVADRKHIATLRDIFVIGEAFPMDVVARWNAISGARAHNLYGPTEAAVSVTKQIAVLDENATVVPIGVPQWNTGALVLDARLHPVPPGVPGELYLTGAQLARGYLKRPAITCDRFVASPIGAPGERMYRTGDLVRWRNDGVLEYLGRTDFQIKLRGQRIELGEIEAALLAHPVVSQAVVLLATDDSTGDYLVAYAVPDEGADVSGDELIVHLQQRLPRYMVPAHITVLAAFPLNPSGKLDRKALPKPDFSPIHREIVAPRTPVEETIAAVFADVLGMDEVSAHDEFFEIGGNSLSATRVIARINEALGSALAVRDIFDAPSVAALADRAEHTSTEQRQRPLVARPRPERVPLSLAQYRMWVLNQLEPGSGGYNLPLALRLAGRLDRDALRGAIRDVIARHETLRTVFPAVDGTPAQVVLPMSEIPLEVPIHTASQQGAEESVHEIAARGFDVSREIPVRGAIFEIAPDHHVVVLVLHHIAADGFSMAPLARDIMLAYHARLHEIEPGWNSLRVHYADFALWQREVLGDESDPGSLASQQIAYWRSELEGLPEVLELPTDHPRPAVQSMRGAVHEFTIPSQLYQRLGALARSNNATTFMVLQTALAVLLARSSSTSDIAIGTPIAGRGDKALDDLVGMFVNTLVLRTRIDDGMSFEALLGRNRETVLGAFGHADVPFERLVEALAPERSAAHSPLFQVILGFENLEQPEFTLDGLTITGVAPGHAIAKYDLHVAIADGMPDGHDVRANITYATDLFRESTIAAMAERFVRLLEGIVSDPGRDVHDFPLLGADQLAELHPVAGSPAEEPVHLSGLMAEAVARGQDGPALAQDGRTLTYRQLDEQSNQLARLLIQHGAGAEQPVAVSIPRSIPSMVAQWAVAKTGATYVPVDPSYPRERIDYMLADSGTRLIVTTVPEQYPDHDVVDLSSASLADHLAALPAEPLSAAELPAPLRIDHPAYMIYTSGSTGNPKGVLVTHRGLASYAREQHDRFGITTSSRVLRFSSPSFDASMLELLMAIPGGACLCIAPQGIYGGEELTAFLRDQAVSHAFVATAALASAPPTSLPELATVVVGGEAVPAELVQRWAPGRSFHIAYGPTETTIVASLSARTQPGDPVLIGGPVRGSVALVLDHHLRPVPEGVPGELYVGGASIARGYHQRAGLTASRFVASPVGAPGSLMYRTGDIAKWARDRDGQLSLAYLGRSDFQVKVRGFRIELGESDAALAQHERVDAAVTVAVRGAANQLQLVAYVTPSGPAPDVDELREHVGGVLPDYMVPAAIMLIEQIPLTPNGKIDRKALPDPQFRTASTRHRAPTTPMEEAIVALIEQLLGSTGVGVDDSFFALGGDSIMSIQLVARAKSAGVILTARDVFEHKTPAALARVATWASESGASLLEELPGGGVGDVPLLPVMQWMTELGGAFAKFSQGMLLTLPPGAGGEQLERTVATVLARHDALRARFARDGAGAWKLTVPPATYTTPAIRHVVFEEITDSAAFASRVRAEHDAAARRLDPARGEMIQFVWFEPAAGAATTGRLLVLAHHLVVDGVSWRILLPDLATAWARSAGSDDIELDPVGTSLRRWAHALVGLATEERTIAELDWWLGRIPSDDAPLGSAAFDPAIHTMGDLEWHDIAVPSEIAEPIINDLPELFRTGVNDALLAGLAVAIARYRAARGHDAAPLLLNLEGHGREEGLVPGADLSRTVGWFTNVFPARIDVPADVTSPLGTAAAAGLIKSVKEQLAGIPRKGMGYGLLRYANPGTAAAFDGMPVPQLSFNYLGRVGSSSAVVATEEYGWLPDGSIAGASGTANDSMGAPGALNINVTAVQDESGLVLRGSLSRIAALFTGDEAQEIVAHWRQALAELATLARHPEAATLTPSDVPLVAVDQATLDAITRRYRDAGLDVRDVWPLTPLQGGLLFHAMLAGQGRDAYIAQTVLHLGGTVDADRWQRAGQAFLDRNANLRAVFVHDHTGSPLQVIVDGAAITWQHSDLTSLGQDVARRRASELREADQLTPFRMDSAPLIRMHLISVAPDEHILLITNHHVLLDGWSMPVVIKELLALYATRGDAQHLPAPRSYRDFLAWLGQQDAEQALSAWADALAGLDEPTLVAPVDASHALAAEPSEVLVPLGDQVPA
ncbi:amino acid adenylation domain-containing protein, partial [Hoyosella sp. G463]